MPVPSLILATMLFEVALFSVAFAQPAGPEFQVNTYTTSFQNNPAIAAAPTGTFAGNFVVAWNSYGGSGTDTSSFSVQARVYDGSGTPLGAQFQVNTFTTGFQWYPSVAVDGSGNFIVAWDTSTNVISARQFDGLGTPLADQFQVNTYTTGTQRNAQVAADASGNFVVVWDSFGSADSDTDFQSIQARLFDGAGSPQGDQFQVNTFTTNVQALPAVAADAAGNFVVVWQGSVSGDVSVGIAGQRYDSAGTPQAGEFQVNTYTTGDQTAPAVAMDGAGNFTVLWQSAGSGGSDTSGLSIQGQRYDSTGAPVGGQFQVNTYTTNDQGSPAVAVDGSGDFTVMWQSNGSAGTDTSSVSVQGQRYDSTGATVGGQFQMNTYTTNIQRDPAVSADGAGNFVVSWESIGSTGNDSSQYSVQAQFLTPPTTSTSLIPTTSTTSTSSTTSSTILPGTVELMPGRIGLVRFATLAKFVAKPNPGDPPFALPVSNPVLSGGALRIFDTAATAGDDTYVLPAGSAWKGLGNPFGSKGYKYKGAGTPSDPCKVVLVKPTVVKAVCKGAGVTLQPPFTGEIGIDLAIGVGDHYCAQFGGDTVKNDTTLTKRKNAPAPGACP